MKGSFFVMAVLVAAICVSPTLGYPTSCAFIPTADVMEPGTIRMELENDGYPSIGRTGSVSYSLNQFGLTPKLEFGVDRYDFSGEPQDSLNVKYLLLKESDAKPAVALGLMDVAEGVNQTYYAVGTRTFGGLRLHAGYIHADYARSPMLGCDQDLGRDTYLLADWIGGSENYLALGLYREFNKSWAVTFFYGFANPGGEDNLAGISLSRTWSFSGLAAR